VWDLGIRPVLPDLSGVCDVDPSGVLHLLEILNYGDAHGGGVSVLESSDALAAYFRDA
jgi:hypothetical protein